MVTLILLVAALIALGLAAYTGRTADSRNPEYTLGPVFDPRPQPQAQQQPSLTS